ncbi:MAG TPA: cytochrome c biogenesis protein ResB [Candidatus Baltobacteraceae bacterium]|jgi:cytochrome c biogenesis protein|nr:cytochrome c biogenesis protein ResB [Candidatus Baltobacteraceae bacterium]
MSYLRAYYADFTRTFSNVLFAVCLLLIWGLLTLAGVIVAQGKDPGDYFSMYAPPLARLILRLNADNIYHTPYYLAIIGLILTSLAVCTFKRVIPARLPRLHPVAVDKIPLSAAITVDQALPDVRARAEGFLRRRGWLVRKREFNGTEWTFADKYNWARRGVLVAHIGFTIIAAGTCVYWARGFSGDLPLLAGQTIAVPHSSASIRLNSFHYRISPIMTKSGMVYQPIDYVSNVTVIQHGTASQRLIRVNHPIDIGGTLFYQSSYGFALRFLVRHTGVRDAALSSKTYVVGDTITLPGSQREIAVAQFIPTVDRQSGQPSSDPRVTNPAVALQVTEGGQNAGAALVPLNTWIDVGDGWRITPSSYVMVSGLQYRYDPGVALVGIGAFVLLAGLVISFYFLPARLFVRITPAPRGTTVEVAATTVKGYDIFEKEFNELLQEFERALRPQEPQRVFAEAT